MKLDNKETLSVIITKEIQQKEVKLIEGNHLSHIFADPEVELENFNKKITKMSRASLGRDREKSYNPMWDKLEKQIVQPEVGVIYTKKEMDNLGLSTTIAPTRFSNEKDNLIIHRTYRKKEKWYRKLWKKIIRN